MFRVTTIRMRIGFSDFCEYICMVFVTTNVDMVICLPVMGGWMFSLAVVTSSSSCFIKYNVNADRVLTVPDGPCAVTVCYSGGYQTNHSD